MRLTFAALALAVLAVGFVAHERKSALESHLGDVATRLAGRDVHVHCQSFAGNLVDISAEAGTVQFDASGTPSYTTDLKRPICNALKRFPHDVGGSAYGCVIASSECPQPIWEDVLAVHTLAHEAWHLNGVASESRAECYALQTTAEAAILLGADDPTALATSRYALAHLYPELPDEYRESDCGNGGPLDLRPADESWP